jgi:cobalt-zinc-cadmium efflux system membrane fusion protein
MAVFAYVPEDDLPRLRGVKKWVVRTVGAEQGVEGEVEDVAPVIDPNQHTATVKGYIPNPDRKIRGGQFASFTIELPPPDDVIEVPMAAVVDDGRQCVVFVQPDPDKPLYTLRRVILTHRFEKTAWVASKITKQQQKVSPEDRQQGVLTPQPLLPGERVILSGVLELKKELEDREASERIKKNARDGGKDRP